MSSWKSDTPDTANVPDDDGETCDESSDETEEECKAGDEISALPSRSGKFLTVELRSSQNFALGDVQRKHGLKIRLSPESEFFPSPKTDEALDQEDDPLTEEKTEPFSLNKQDSPESQPIFSEFIEELLFNSDPLFDDDSSSDTDFYDEGSKRNVPFESKNICKTLRTLIENLEGLSKSLDATTKSFPILASRSQVKEPVETSANSPSSAKPPLTTPLGSSLVAPKTDQVDCRTKFSTISFKEPVKGDTSKSSHSEETLSDICMPLTDSEMSNSKYRDHLKCLTTSPVQPLSAAEHQSGHSLTSTFPTNESCSGHPESSDKPKSSCLINFIGSFNETVQSVASQFGMEQSSENSDVLWVDRDPSFNKLSVAESIGMYKKLKSYQRVNHFPGSWGLGLKDLLAKNLSYMRTYFPDDYDFSPQTWILPHQTLELENYASHHQNMYFVIKPTETSSGLGVKVTNDIYEECESSLEKVCQVHIKPFLIDGYKFDVRVFALVTSCDPLRVFVYDEGFVRFATEKYEDPSEAKSTNFFMHLTDTRVKLDNPKYVHDEFCGSLLRTSTVFQWLRLNEFNDEMIQASMDDAIVKTIIANLANLRDYYQICFTRHSFPSACFEILGFDIMLDNDLKLYLLDVDCSPSFDCETGDPFEREVKTALLCDVFTILNLSASKRHENVDKDESIRETLLEKLLRRKEEMRLTETQIEWEDSHLGKFRKIFPPVASQTKYYQKLVDRALKNPHIV